MEVVPTNELAGGAKMRWSIPTNTEYGKNETKMQEQKTGSGVNIANIDEEGARRPTHSRTMRE